MRTQVGIVGAGPSGLLLSQLLHLHGIDSVIVEIRSREHVESRIRAGVLEQGTVDLLEQAQVAERLHREGLVHGGIELSVDGRRHRIDFENLTGGKAVTVYGQTEITKDLNEARLAAGGQVVYEAEDVGIHGFDGDSPRITFRKNGEQHTLACEFIAGCDGFHGVCRRSIPRGALRIFEREYPFAWLGILARTRPVSRELIYARHGRGFALFSMRSPSLSRLYLQCDPEEDLSEWPDDRVWDELRLRLGGEAGDALRSGPVIEKGVTPMRSFVAEPMRHGRLFLAGDAAHIVPPTGAKGLNLAAADIRMLSRALVAFYDSGSSDLMDCYSETCLRRVWKAQRFSWWMTSLLHRFPQGGDFAERVQLAELDYLTSSRAAATALAENYVGLPFDD
ncbi:MAG: 4-hydroxybenzoate 3-monooxygenase [Gammaproteobacteria bacterium]|nr:4-hydroxybenzoate 3-monooxygenase [Gammaproteobacteria bacterium]